MPHQLMRQVEMKKLLIKEDAYTAKGMQHLSVVDTILNGFECHILTHVDRFVIWPSKERHVTNPTESTVKVPRDMRALRSFPFYFPLCQYCTYIL